MILLKNVDCTRLLQDEDTGPYSQAKGKIAQMVIVFGIVKGQLQRFHKLISNDRIWPSQHGFEVIFEKSLFVFEISAFKFRN